MSLMDSIRKTVSKEKIGEENLFTPTYKTGFDIIDYRNGRIESGDSIIGLDGGRILTIIGKSGSGKSSIARQIAINIANNYDESQIIDMDFEKGMNLARIQAFSGWDSETIEKKYMLLNREITSESLYKLVKSINKIKTDPNNWEELKIDTGKKDIHGNKIFTLPPSIIIVDSWALMVPKDISEEEELSGSMSASSIAKTNNAIIKRIVGDLEAANIMLIIINHITQKIEIGFSKTQAAVNYLKQDESLPGGSSAIYLSNTLLKIITSSKLDEKEGLGIKGFQCIGEFIKSRSNEAGRQFDLVFSQAEGFDNILTNFVILKNAGYLKGSPRGYYFEGAEDIKFTQKAFKEKYNSSEKLRKVFDKLVKELFINYIPRPNGVGEIKYNTNEITYELIDKEQDIWIGTDGKYYDKDHNEIEIEIEE